MKSEFIDLIRAMNIDADAFFQALEEKPTLALRVNPMKAVAYDAAMPFVSGKVPWAKDGYYLKDDVRPGLSVAYAAGAFYLQEAGAMATASVLDAKPGERILDLCAAPGGKATQAAASLGTEGLLVANEIVPKRAAILAESLTTFGAGNAVAVNERPDRLAAAWGGYFDGVIVDAPCSGEGMFRRVPEAREEWQPDSPEGCARRQAEIMDSAAELVRPGGRLVYSTCTFNETENEGTIRHFLERHPDFHFEDFTLEGVGTSVNGCLRLWPHLVKADGHFVAKLVRDGDERPAEPKNIIDKELPKLVKKLADEIGALPDWVRSARLMRFGDYVHAVPAACPDLKGIRIAKPGLTLMRVGRSHVEPMKPLALAAGMTFRRTVDLSEADAKRFLDRETIDISAPDGRTAVCCLGLPIGWAKVVDNKLKPGK